MNITIIGASAGLGLETVKRGLNRNHSITTLFSDFAKLIVQIHNENKINIPVIFVTGFGAGESKYYVS
jgi:putative NADH-flavin reductase